MRLRALFLTCVIAGACAAALPSSASATEEPFCQWLGLSSGGDCFAVNRHSLLSVRGYTWPSNERICAATYTAPQGVQSTSWVCDYSSVTRSFAVGMRVDGIGVIHNGDPSFFYGYGIQDF